MKIKKSGAQFRKEKQIKQIEEGQLGQRLLNYFKKAENSSDKNPNSNSYLREQSSSNYVDESPNEANRNEVTIYCESSRTEIDSESEGDTDDELVECEITNSCVTRKIDMQVRLRFIMCY